MYATIGNSLHCTPTFVKMILLTYANDNMNDINNTILYTYKILSIIK